MIVEVPLKAILKKICFGYRFEGCDWLAAPDMWWPIVSPFFYIGVQSAQKSPWGQRCINKSKVTFCIYIIHVCILFLPSTPVQMHEFTKLLTMSQMSRV